LLRNRGRDARMRVPYSERSYSCREIEIAMARDIFQMDAFGVGDKDWNGAGHTSSDVPLALGKQVGVLLPWPLCLCRTG
jgi:hypothetical protein